MLFKPYEHSGGGVEGATGVTIHKHIKLYDLIHIHRL